MGEKMMTEFEKMQSGALYLYPDHEEAFLAARDERLEMLYDFNHARPREEEKRLALLAKMFAALGEGCHIEPPFAANLGGMFVHFGRNVYANFGFTLVDDAPIYVGDGTLFGPNVTLTTAGHPIDSELRAAGYIFCEPIHIGRNCWIGADVSILPGVTIGDNAVIGAHSTVTRDIPADVVAYGSPCRGARKISARDKEFYSREKRIRVEER